MVILHFSMHFLMLKKKKPPLQYQKEMLAVKKVHDRGGEIFVQPFLT